MRNKKEEAVNPDLWERLLRLLDGAGHQVDLLWLRGHAGDEENERADELAVAALRGPDLAIDDVYERGR
jgi:ribonuclease HI